MTDEEFTGNLKRKLEKLFDASLKLTVPDETCVEPVVKFSDDGRHGDYQCNNAMRIWSIIERKDTQFKGPPAVGQALMNNLPSSDLVESCSVAGPGFVNVVLSAKWIAKSIENMLMDGIETWAPSLSFKRALVDFSSPNIAKELHVAHLRSTIIGDTIARLLEYANLEVLRRNHVGDWGTQFGMLIEHLFEKFPDAEVSEIGDHAIGDLQAFYKESKLKFDENPVFKQKARNAVVRLQGGDHVYREAWAKICEISRIELDKIYQRLGIELEEKGESFYNPYIANVIEELNQKGLVQESAGARVIRIEEGVNLIVVKQDGGYNYATTDLTALWYRLNEEKAERIIYVADVTQKQHFDMVFKAARQADWLPDNDKTYPRVSHVQFGLVAREDGKRFSTRSGFKARLASFLDVAKSRSKDALIKRSKARFERDNKEKNWTPEQLEENWTPEELEKDWTPEELDKTAEAVGYATVKYADLKGNRETSYIFKIDQKFSDKGDKAVYLLYAHARIFSILKKSGKDMDELKKTGKITLDHAAERALGLHLIRFAETVEEACATLLPNVLCNYLYKLSEAATKFYSDCPVKGSAEETQTSRLLLCEATGIVMRKCFHLLGITPVYKL